MLFMLIVFLMLFLSTSIGIKAQHFLVVSVCARVIMAKRGRRTRYAPVRGDDEVFLGKETFKNSRQKVCKEKLQN
jgi:hypothetical protein